MTASDLPRGNRSGAGADAALDADPGAMPDAVGLPAAIRDAIVAHALAELPNEACGIVVGDRPGASGGRALRFVPARNAATSPTRYELDGRDLVRLTLEIDDRGEAFWAIVHSHVRGEPRPSPTDVAGAHHPEALHLVVGPLDGSRPPEVRAWLIAGPGVREIAIEVR